MIDKKFAEHFARDWIDSWNSHDLDRILAHYLDQFEMSSPVIIQIAGEPSGTLNGKELLLCSMWGFSSNISKELSFGDPVSLPGFDQHFSTYAAVTQNSGDSLRDCATIAECLVRYRDNRHIIHPR